MAWNTFTDDDDDDDDDDDGTTAQYRIVRRIWDAVKRARYTRRLNGKGHCKTRTE